MVRAGGSVKYAFIEWISYCHHRDFHLHLPRYHVYGGRVLAVALEVLREVSLDSKKGVLINQVDCCLILFRKVLVLGLSTL